MTEWMQVTAQGDLEADVERQPLTATNTIVEQVENGDVPSRVRDDFADSDDSPVASPATEVVPAWRSVVPSKHHDDVRTGRYRCQSDRA